MTNRFEEMDKEDAEAEATKQHNAPLDWPNFLTRDLGEIDWLPGKLMARGQLIALVGDGKAGKSVLSQEWAWRSAAGLPFLGDVSRPPLRVLYVDQENTHDDIQERMLSYGATADQLANLVYLSFPALRSLDTADGGGDLVAEVEKHRADVVFIDTISRMIKGKENDADTWLDVYRYSLVRLKRRGVSCVRLDHFGKDKDRGARGNSAKTQDVDHAWELTEVSKDDRLQLRRTHTRTGHGADHFALRRLGRKVNGRWQPGETRHVLAAPGGDEPASLWLVAQAIAHRLDDAGVPRNLGRDRLRPHCANLKIEARNEVLAEVVKIRKNLSRDLGDRLPEDLSHQDQDR